MDGAAEADAAAGTADGQEAVDAAAAAGAAASGGQHVAQLLQRLLLPRIKATLGESNLAVRQVCDAFVKKSRFQTRKIIHGSIARGGTGCCCSGCCCCCTCWPC